MRIFNNGPSTSIEYAMSEIERSLYNLSSIVPVVRIDKSHFGRDTIMLFLSFDKKEDWKNGIAENSNYIRVMVESDGTVECFTRSLYKKNKSISFENRLAVQTRKATVKTLEAAIAKVKKYITDINTQLSITD